MVSLDDFPVELVHKILRHAAQSSSSACRTLCQVSAWTRCIALPHFYTTISIRSETNLSRFLSSITSLPVLPPNPTFDPAVNVQNIWIAFKSIKLNQEMFQSRTIECFPNLSHLAFTACNTGRLARMGTFAFIPTDLHRGKDLHVLILHNSTGMPNYSHRIYTHHHLFSRITHLRFADPVALYSQLYISHMRRLTHIAVPCGLADVDDILPIIEGTLVKVFVIVLPSDESHCRDIETWVCETRRSGRSEHIYAVRPLCGDIRDEWDAEIRGGAAVWERAFEHTRLLMARTPLYRKRWGLRLQG
ncbi:hypothetical protein BD779DRAFT_1475766 [Infundibulicybe gibba]|nr:hypothetical protein BD779DRAFT_1475766 [Infundibulicybe gibba]